MSNRYIVFSLHDKDQFEKDIAKALDAGYELVGGVCVETIGRGLSDSYRIYSQAITKVYKD